jgi:hypothetical protein
MRDVLGDFMNVASRGLMARTTLQKWHEEVEYAVLHEVLELFELQLTRPDGTRAALRYTVRDDGTVAGGAKAGGVDFFGLPDGTRVGLHVAYRAGAKNLESVQAYLRARGWGSGGTLVTGDAVRDRSFSKDGFGIARDKVGDWR